MSEDQFNTLFQRATNVESPYRYQRDLAMVGDTIPQLLNIPTGLGKTAAAVLAWLWRRRFADESIRKQTPRRLVYCLPMRVLVEQTFSETVRWLNRLGLLAGEAVWENTGDDELPMRSSPQAPSIVHLAIATHTRLLDRLVDFVRIECVQPTD